MAARKIVLVTGANSGIGYETVKAFLQSSNPYHLLVGSRTLEKAQAAISELHNEVPGSSNTMEALPVDITSDESINKAFEQVKTNSGHIDALVNNAGASFHKQYVEGKLTIRECFNKSYDVNLTGTHVMTETFMPLLFKSSDPRLIFVAGLSQITVAAEKYFPTPPRPAGWPKPTLDFDTIAYRCSKVALNMLMLDWNHKLQADAVKVWACGPGFLTTNLGGMRDVVASMGGKHPSVGGLFLRDVVEGKRDEDVGKLINKDGFSAW